MIRARSFRQVLAGFALIRTAIVTSVLLVAGLLAGVSPASAAAAPASPVSLGAAAGFSVLAGGISSTGASVLALDLGVDGEPVGFPPGTVTGTTHVGDAAVQAAQSARQEAYDSVVAQSGGTAFAGDLAGKTFTPGLYSAAAAITNTGTITLDAAGDPGAIFVFKIGAALSSAAASKVVLKNGALANNVYWQAVGAVAFGANVSWVGTLLAAGVVTFGEAASLKGRVLTSGTVTLANSPITKPIDDLVAPVVAIDGGSATSTGDTTPRVSGTTDEPGSPLVTVTTGSQVLTTRATGGAWTVSAGTLVSGPHTVVAAVTDPSGNRGTATQILTVDTSVPVISVTGGATAATNDITPIISGTTDQPGSPTVTVTVGGQTLTTTAADGAWTVEADPLAETAHLVEAFVGGAAGSTGSGRQVLTVDVTLPVLTINGGPTRSTSDTSPWIYGTTAEKAGTTVDVRVGAQLVPLRAVVLPGGTWGVSAEAMPSGTVRVLASITDAAQNTGTVGQVLQIGSVVTTPPVGPVPPISVDGGPTGTTSDTTPTISGTTHDLDDAEVAVSVGGQTYVTTADDSGAWSIEVGPLPEGSHTVVVRITDAQGNVTSATQVLTVGSVDAPADPPADPPATPSNPPAVAPATFRPDAEIRLAKRSFQGRGEYRASRQKVTATLNGRRARTAIFEVRLTNRGNADDRLTIRGTRKNKRFTVVYLDGRRNVTAAVLAGSHRTQILRPGESTTLTVRVTKVARAVKGSRRTFSVRAVSANDGTRLDTVLAVSKVTRG